MLDLRGPHELPHDRARVVPAPTGPTGSSACSSASVRDRHLVPADRSVDVLFHEFMADDIATVERIYEPPA